MHPTNASVAAALRAELARAGMSGRALAREMGWSYGYISRRLNSKAEPRPFRVDELTRIAQRFGVPVTRFLEHDDQQVAS